LLLGVEDVSGFRWTGAGLGSCRSVQGRDPEQRLQTAELEYSDSFRRYPIDTLSCTEIERRTLCISGLALFLFGLPSASNAAAVPGAAELDAEYYLRGLIGRPAPRVDPIQPRQPRQLDAVSAGRLVGVCESQIASFLGRSVQSLRDAAASRRQRLRMEMDRTRLSGAFARSGYDGALEARANAQGSAATIGEFDFDLNLYALFSLLAEQRQASARLDEFYVQLGDALLDSIRADTESVLSTSPKSLTALCAGLKSLLEEAKATGYLAGYFIDDSDVDDALWSNDDDLSVTRISVTLERPASLNGALLLNGENARVSPELMAPTLAAYVRACGAVVKDSSQFFVDEYRPNPFEYRPSQLLLELTLAPAPPARRGS